MKHLILGAGGHGRVLLELLRSSGAEVLGLTDVNASRRGATLDGCPILGDDSVVLEHAPKAIALVNGLGLAAPGERKRLFERLRARGYRFPAVFSASSYRAQGVTLAEGAQILTRAILHPGASIGENSVVNTAAIIEHDCSVGAHAFIAPGAVLCGGAQVEEEVLIGAGAVLLPGVRIGARAVVGAGAVVTRDVEPDARALGLPARMG